MCFPGPREREKPMALKAKAPSVAVNTQLDAALLNSQAFGKLINKASNLDQLINKEIGKTPAAGQRPTTGFLTPMHTP